MEPMQLQAWANAQTIGDDMLWKGSWGNQIQFFRDNIAQLFCCGIDYEDQASHCTVISTHRSKSIILPVYKLHREDYGLTMVFRNNFYNWKMSVISERPIITNFDGLFHTTPPIEPDYTGNELADCYFEGFPHEYIFGYYSELESYRKKFSAEIWGNQPLWTAVFLMLRDLGIVKAAEWHTKESHRKELDEQTARRKAREAKEKTNEANV